MKKPGTQPTYIRLPSELHAAAKQRAADEDRSLASLIRRALRDYLGQS